MVPKKTSGFTLIELLVSVIIFSLLIGLASLSFRMYISILKKTKILYPETAVKYSKLAAIFRSTFYYTAVRKSLDGRNIYFYYFYGSPKKVRFITSKPVYIKDNLALCEVFLKNNSLYITEVPVYSKYVNFLNPDINTKIAITRKIFNNVSDVSFEYYTDNDVYNNIKEIIPSAIKMNIAIDNNRIELFFKIRSDFESKKNITKYLYDLF